MSADSKRSRARVSCLVSTKCASYRVEAASITKNLDRSRTERRTAPHERHMLECGRAPHTAGDVAGGAATPFAPCNAPALWSYMTLDGSILGIAARNEDKRGETQPHAPRKQASARRLRPSY